MNAVACARLAYASGVAGRQLLRSRLDEFLDGESRVADSRHTWVVNGYGKWRSLVGLLGVVGWARDLWQGLGKVRETGFGGISAGQQQCERVFDVSGVMPQGLGDVGGAGQSVQGDGQVPQGGHDL